MAIKIDEKNLDKEFIEKCVNFKDIYSVVPVITTVLPTDGSAKEYAVVFIKCNKFDFSKLVLIDKKSFNNDTDILKLIHIHYNSIDTKYMLTYMGGTMDAETATKRYISEFTHFKGNMYKTIMLPVCNIHDSNLYMIYKRIEDELPNIYCREIKEFLEDDISNREDNITSQKYRFEKVVNEIIEVE